jgi:hypothetical protein
VSADPERVLAASVFSDGRDRPFGELTVAAVAARAAELRQGAGLGHRSRVAAVAAAWDSLAAQMRERGAATVGDLDPQTVAERAEALWVVPPGGSLLR